MNTKQLTSTQSFASHMCKYLGVGLISGSIVHAGTLGGDYIKYVVLIILGVMLFITGNVLEYGISSLKKLLPYIGISTVLSIGTGMVSGGTQHYLDGPSVTAVLFPIGFFLAYLSFIYRDYRAEFTFKKIIAIAAISITLFVVLSYVAKQLSRNTDYSQASGESTETATLQSDGHNHKH